MPFDGILDTAKTAGEPAAAEAHLADPQRQADVLAHDLNNLLAVILNANEALVAALPAGTLGRELAEMSQDAAAKAGELLRRLRDGAAEDAADAEGVDCAETVATTAKFARGSLPEQVAVEVIGADQSLRCAADPVRLEAALLNLCVNAGHAMPQGGSITLSLAAADLRPPAQNDLGLAAGRYAVIAVADTGVGMSPEVLARATEPRFSTRAGRGGKGLGLSSVKDFAEAAGGRLLLKSHEGEGTTATLFLPLA
ncbi:MAG TPA: ATP-binding protein [Phenylobacterium sp.]|nr:ATP-binding protein [Phenylobacterium sp.]